MADFIATAESPQMDDEYQIITSPLSQKVTRDGVTIDVQIYRGEDDAEWLLEVVDQDWGSTVWEATFASDQDALNEVFRTIATEGIRCFATDPIQKLH